MLISEFAKATELPVDTIRFYISKAAEAGAQRQGRL